MFSVKAVHFFCFKSLILYLQKEKKDRHVAVSEWKCVFSEVKWGREIFLALTRAVDLSNVERIGVVFIKNVSVRSCSSERKAGNGQSERAVVEHHINVFSPLLSECLRWFRLCCYRRNIDRRAKGKTWVCWSRACVSSQLWNVKHPCTEDAFWCMFWTCKSWRTV